jgi:hypothetical protein
MKRSDSDDSDASEYVARRCFSSCAMCDVLSVRDTHLLVLPHSSTKIWRQRHRCPFLTYNPGHAAHNLSLSLSLSHTHTHTHTHTLSLSLSLLAPSTGSGLRAFHPNGNQLVPPHQRAPLAAVTGSDARSVRPEEAGPLPQRRKGRRKRVQLMRRRVQPNERRWQPPRKNRYG